MSETIEKTFTVSSPARLNLSNIRGSVEIRTGEEGVIKVTAVKQTGSGDPKSTEIEMVQEADGTVKVATHYPEAWWGWLIGSFPCAVEYTVQAPRNCSLKVNGVSNETSAAGFEGEFNFHSVSGEMSVRDLKGPMKISTVSGRMELEDLTGEMKLNTVSGKISGRRLNGQLHLGYRFRAGRAEGIQPGFRRGPHRQRRDGVPNRPGRRPIPLQFRLRQRGTAGPGRDALLGRTACGQWIDLH